MNFKLKQSIIGLLVMTVLLYFTGWAVFKYALPEQYFGFYPVLVFLFFIINTGFLAFFYRAIKASNVQFIRSFMLSIGIKFLIYVILILVYMLTKPRFAIPFSITVGILYLAYTMYDILIMIYLLNHKE